MHGDAKLGGILIETQGLTPAVRSGERYLVVGIGLNVQPPPAEPGDAYAIAGLAEIDARLDAPTALARVARPLLETLAVFERAGFDDALRTRELVKVQLGRTVETKARDVANALAMEATAEVVQVIGRTFTLYRHNPELKRKAGELPPWRR